MPCRSFEFLLLERVLVIFLSGELASHSISSRREYMRNRYLGTMHSL